MAHAHDHCRDSGRPLLVGIVLNVLYTIAGFICGVVSGSLTLVADAVHNATDSLTLGVAYVAQRIARRRPDARKTFGYGRATILAALINASFLIGVSVVVALEAIDRLQHPAPVQANVVVGVALLGIVVNAITAFLLSRHRQQSHVQSAFLDQLFDAFSSLGAVIAGLVIMFTGIAAIDSMIALVVIGLLLYHTFKLLQRTMNVLLEGVPEGVDSEQVRRDIAAVDQVRGVDDMHIWAIGDDYVSLSCHILLDKASLARGCEIVQSVKQLLSERHAIHHATIEIETTAADPEDAYHHQ